MSAAAVLGLMDELRADQDPRTQCRFCIWAGTLDSAARKEWAAVVVDRSFTHASLFRAAKRRGYSGSAGSVETHRKNEHQT